MAAPVELCGEGVWQGYNEFKSGRNVRSIEPLNLSVMPPVQPCVTTTKIQAIFSRLVSRLMLVALRPIFPILCCDVCSSARVKTWQFGISLAALSIDEDKVLECRGSGFNVPDGSGTVARGWFRLSEMLVLSSRNVNIVFK